MLFTKAFQTFLMWFLHGVFDLHLVEEQNLKKFVRWTDKKGRFIHDFPLGIVLARKPVPAQ